MDNFVIIANGNFLIKEIIIEAIQDKIIIALDGAMNHLYRLGIKPDILLGDFDSISTHVAADTGVTKKFGELTDNDIPYQHNQVKIIPALNQDLTDLTKAIQYCDQQNASSITLICALGGRVDHQEYALRLLCKAYQKDRPMLLHSEHQTLRFAKDETVKFNGEIGDNCGILAFPKAIITTQGLQYDVQNFPLNFAYSESVCNALREKTVTIIVKGEALLVMPPLLQAQRDFMKLDAQEQLRLQLRDLRL